MQLYIPPSISLAVLTLTLGLHPLQVLADGSSIIAAMSNISNATITMNETVASFPDNVFLDVPAVGTLLVDSVGVLNAVNEGTTIAGDSANLTILEAIHVAQATVALSKVVVSTLEDLASPATKEKFDRLLFVSPVVLGNLKVLWAATDAFGAAVVAKVPAQLAGTAKILLGPIDNAFNTTIAVYSS